MTLHLLKLCVGCESIADLEGWIEEQSLQHRRLGQTFEPKHTTRMVPTRAKQIITKTGDNGSLYWVIKGQIACRQALVDIRPFTDAGGIGRCHLVLDPRVVPVRPRPFRAFQGWRYLTAKDAPPDADRHAAGSAELPEDLRRELAGLGLL